MHASHAPMAATGWNRTTYNVGKHADIVYNITKLLEFIVPRYIFFLFAFFMVAFALGDTFYCLRLFKVRCDDVLTMFRRASLVLTLFVHNQAGEITKIGPIKALRFMVAVVVTVLFSSTMKWFRPAHCCPSRTLHWQTHRGVLITLANDFFCVAGYSSQWIA